jgi:hypothetical protein
MRQRLLFFPLLPNLGSEFLAKAIKPGKEIKGMQLGKKEVKLSLFSDDIILYIKDLKESTKNTLI